MDDLFYRHSFRILSLSPSLLLSYLNHRTDNSKCLAVWHSLLSEIASTPRSDRLLESKATGNLLAAVQKGQLPRYLTPQDGELNDLIGGLLQTALSESINADEASLLKEIFKFPGLFFSPFTSADLTRVSL